MEHRSGVGAGSPTLVCHISFPELARHLKLNIYLYILYYLYFYIKTAANPARKVSPPVVLVPAEQAAPCSRLPPLPPEWSAELWALDFTAPRCSQRFSFLPSDAHGLEPLPHHFWRASLACFVAFFSSSCTHMHTHTQGKIRSDKACRWKLGNGAIIVSHVILIQAFVHGF